MRDISVNTIRDTVKDLFSAANVSLENKEKELIVKAWQKESDKTAIDIMDTLVQNLEIAEKEKCPICQDTGMAIVYLEVGQDVHFIDGELEKAVNEGVKSAYTESYFRLSVVDDPVFDRKNTNDNTPAVIYTRIVPGENVKITAIPKGFGSENKSQIKMFNPTASLDSIVDFVVEVAKNAGSSACPPFFIGVGIGGTFDYCAYLAKMALTRGASTHNKDPKYAELETTILNKINDTNIGPQGFGGQTTALGVNIEYYPTHIAGLPVAVNMCCHAMRHKSKVI